VINNLVINADQAMPDGGSLTVRAFNRTLTGTQGGALRAGDYACITIEDEGTGIPKEHLSRIFDPYFTTKQKGSGLGLATSYAIIKKHGGDILVESELGLGSRFHVFLPAVREADAPELVVDKDEITPGHGRVLIMDDEQVVRDVARAMLEEIGYSVTLSCDGREAVELYCKAMESGDKFDLVILDLTVPGGVGGKETVRRLLEIDSSVNAVVSSGYSVDPVLSRYRENGFKGIISKPYRLKDLSDCLTNVLSLQADKA
jgi:two-component system, cell cycle sensor histidine kinase and response regulator CckA